ncbi:hypothetical protein BD410DRAFT_844133 [Rickenella mellea]|uniref:Uncharacterized protein n=1 Tax=Rickenella mellea TaxID=50990 RepID=A0A4Y7PNU1_9AGAM|nr:hypothetical protein BD410DRAFT_844133 [Rickenella mellea]
MSIWAKRRLVPGEGFDLLSELSKAFDCAGPGLCSTSKSGGVEHPLWRSTGDKNTQSGDRITPLPPAYLPDVGLLEWMLRDFTSLQDHHRGRRRFLRVHELDLSVIRTTLDPMKALGNVPLCDNDQ